MSLSKLTVVELKKLAKNKKLKGYSKLRKAELVLALRSPPRSLKQSSKPKTPSNSLSKLTVIELKELAKNKKLKGYSKLRKAELISALRSPPRSLKRNSVDRSKAKRSFDQRSPRKIGKGKGKAKTPPPRRKSPRQSKSKRGNPSDYPDLDCKTPYKEYPYPSQFPLPNWGFEAYDLKNVATVISSCIGEKITIQIGTKPGGFGTIYKGKVRGENVIVKTTEVNIGKKVIESVYKSKAFKDLMTEAKYYAYMSDKNIGPKVYHIFTKNIDERLIQFIIMKQYDYSLFDYLGRKDISENDKIKAVDSMIKIYIEAVNTVPVPLYCSDIKLGNFVIDKATKEVKMIDFDPFFCKENAYIATSEQGAAKKLIITKTQYDTAIKPYLDAKTKEAIAEYAYTYSNEYEAFLTFISVLLILVQIYAMAVQNKETKYFISIKDIFIQFKKLPSWIVILRSMKLLLDRGSGISVAFVDYTKMGQGVILETFINKHF